MRQVVMATSDPNAAMTTVITTADSTTVKVTVERLQ